MSCDHYISCAECLADLESSSPEMRERAEKAEARVAEMESALKDRESRLDIVRYLSDAEHGGGMGTTTAILVFGGGCSPCVPVTVAKNPPEKLTHWDGSAFRLGCVERGVPIYVPDVEPATYGTEVDEQTTNDDLQEHAVERDQRGPLNHAASCPRHDGLRCNCPKGDERFDPRPSEAVGGPVFSEELIARAVGGGKTSTMLLTAYESACRGNVTMIARANGESIAVGPCSKLRPETPKNHTSWLLEEIGWTVEVLVAVEKLAREGGLTETTRHILDKVVDHRATLESVLRVATVTGSEP